MWKKNTKTQEIRDREIICILNLAQIPGRKQRAHRNAVSCRLVWSSIFSKSLKYLSACIFRPGKQRKKIACFLAPSGRREITQSDVLRSIQIWWNHLETFISDDSIIWVPKISSVQNGLELLLCSVGFWSYKNQHLYTGRSRDSSYCRKIILDIHQRQPKHAIKSLVHGRCLNP